MWNKARRCSLRTYARLWTHRQPEGQHNHTAARQTGRVHARRQRRWRWRQPKRSRGAGFCPSPASATSFAQQRCSSTRPRVDSSMTAPKSVFTVASTPLMPSSLSPYRIASAHALEGAQSCIILGFPASDLTRKLAQIEMTDSGVDNDKLGFEYKTAYLHRHFRQHAKRNVHRTPRSASSHFDTT